MVEILATFKIYEDVDPPQLNILNHTPKRLYYITRNPKSTPLLSQPIRVKMFLPKECLG